MRLFILWSTALLLGSLPSLATADAAWSLHSEGGGLHTLEFDSTRTKCTIVEFSDRIYLIEVSLSSQGGGARTLTEHRAGGESILQILDQSFPDQPLAAVLHSHWHPHSLSSVAPFLERQIPLVTTRANFERIQEFIDPALLQSSGDLIRYVEGERMILGDGDETIVVHRLVKDDYPSIPTPDYLFFEMPSLAMMHTGCMYSISRSGPIAGRELIPSRAMDLNRFITSEQLELDGLLRVYLDSEAPTDEDPGTEVIAASRLANTIRDGITSTEVGEPYRILSAEELRDQRDRLLAQTIADGVPAGILNGLVYQELGAQNLAKARELALLQSLVAPSDPNAWDTLGEVYYFLGELEVARFYETQSRAIDPGFDTAGEAAWVRDLADHRKRWEAAEQPHR